MALPASVANVRDSGVVWAGTLLPGRNSQAEEGFGSCHLLLFEQGWENLGGMCHKRHFSTSEDTLS